MQAVLLSFQSAQVSSQILQDLTTPGRRLPKFGKALEELLRAADWEAAAQQGRIVPNQVMRRGEASLVSSRYFHLGNMAMFQGWIVTTSH